MSSEANTAVIISVCTVTVLLRIKSSSVGQGHTTGMGGVHRWGQATAIGMAVGWVETVSGAQPGH